MLKGLEIRELLILCLVSGVAESIEYTRIYMYKECISSLWILLVRYPFIRKRDRPVVILQLKR